MKYFCEKCNFSTTFVAKWNRHLDSTKHIINCSEDELDDEDITTYSCDICKKNFETKYSYDRHIYTQKHRFNQQEYDRTTTFETKMELKQMAKKLKMAEQKLEIKEMAIKLKLTEQKLEEQIKSSSGNTIINNINNINNVNNTMNVDQSIKNNFNLNIFLNEDCKDALNITDFINGLSLTLADLEQTARLGYTEGITKIIVDRIKEIGINRRPYHCTDLKREIVYIKDEDLWEKEQNDKPRIKKMISNIIHKNLEQLTDWKDSHPGCMDLTNPNGEAYLNMMIEANGGSDRDRKENKILKNILEDANITS